MKKIQIWLVAARLRTLPLSVSGILTGNALALSKGVFSYPIFYMSLLTAICFQVISNFANDYGDGVKGTDNNARVGPKRVIQQGLLTPQALKRGILFLSFITLTLAFVLILTAFGVSSLKFIFIFLGLAVFAVIAAIKYTVGSGAYGYHGWGDFFVLVFFGGVSVLGSSFLQLKALSIDAFLFAGAIGLLSVGVLNLNNMRDHKNDRFAGKHTLVVRMGIKNAKIYHALLILIPLLLLSVNLGIPNWHWHSLPYLMFIPLLIHFQKVMVERDPEKLDPQLKPLALSIFFLSLLLFVVALSL